MIALYEEKEPKGEYVLIVEGAKEEAPPQITVEKAAEMARELIDKGMKASDACKQIAAKTEFSKSEIYKALQE